KLFGGNKRQIRRARQSDIEVCDTSVENRLAPDDINQMEYVIPPVILLLLVRYGLAALITWFFETVVEPRAAAARQKDTSQVAPRPEASNAQKMEATRAGLDQLRARLQDR
ncbi:hypothetical protein, partial [uncultured Ruegeria sp.]|uniref:hypothetical protein n=1 Tax=uncultured Ruegeria sp. TaxID=259304 RepID=UPI00262F3F39